MILYLKDGSKIHIKEKNKGSFTRWCGGNVTSACIAKGKNSSNPAIRKKATFAANARKWKHQKGGILKSQFGSKILLGGPINTKNSKVKEVLSYLPFSGSAIDVETAIKNPTLSNIGWAAWSVGSDIFGSRILRDLQKSQRAYKEAKATTKAAEEALDTHRQSTKHIMARSVREEDKRLAEALRQAREQEALKWGVQYWDKAISYPVYGAWIGNDAGINYLQNHKKGGKLCLIPRS